MPAELRNAASDSLRALRVLIVDDNPGDRYLYKQMLVDADPGTRFSFEEADNGAEALKLTRENWPDCILLDYLLPDMLGIELLRTLTERRERSMLPVVMLTGFGDEATAVDALQSGAHGYIAKRELTGVALSRAIDRAVRACASHDLLEQSRSRMAERNRELERKYEQVEGFYQKILGRLQNPARELRARIAEVADTVDRGGPASLRQDFKVLRAESERLVIALTNLSDNPVVNLGQLLISTHPESIFELVSETVNMFRPAVDAAGVRLSVNLQPGLPEVPVDRYRIEQVLANLLDNAIRNTPAGGRVYLKVERMPGSPGEITVTVSDTGCGFAPDRLQNVFERHPQDAAADGVDAPGVGLHVCKEIIRSHGGRIWAKSLPEAGTSFSFTLPLEDGAAAAGEPWERGGARRSPSSQWPQSGQKNGTVPRLVARAGSH